MAKPMLIDLDAVLLPGQRPGVSLGITRMEKILAALGHPERSVPAIHVAGSNGKGSVCAYTSAILRAAGYRVGRYTSPHLVSWNERICLDGRPIATEVMGRLLHRVQEVALADPPTKFELLTAVAWLYFAEAQVDIAVIEVGLGGRLDATNTIQHPLATVITSISREHWQILGATLPEIAAEKAGILKAGCPVAIGQLPPEALAVVVARAQTLGCPYQIVTPAQSRGSGLAQWQDLTYPLPLAGAVQLHNSALAITTIRSLPPQWSITATAIRQGMAQARWPGRLHVCLWQGREILLDGAHNPEAAIALRQYVDEYLDAECRPICWVLGMLNTKEHLPILQALLRPGDRVHWVPVPDELTMNPADLAALATSLDLVDLTQTIHPSWQEGLDLAITGNISVVMAGSLYLLGDFYRQVDPPGMF